MSEKDVKDASAGVLKDLKRFQLEKEDDLKRYMVSVLGISTLPAPAQADGSRDRLHMPSAISTGQRRTSTRGEKREKRWTRSKRGSHTCKWPCLPLYEHWSNYRMVTMCILNDTLPERGCSMSHEQSIECNAHIVMPPFSSGTLSKKSISLTHIVLYKLQRRFFSLVHANMVSSTVYLLYTPQMRIRRNGHW